MTEITMTCRPFARFGRGAHRIWVSADGEVLVYDLVAGHYTRCHSLSAGSMARARGIARLTAERDRSCR